MTLLEIYGVSDEELANRMNHMLEVWLDNPLLPLEEVAEKAKVSRSTFLRYRQNEKFMEEYRKRCRAKFSALEAKALEVLELKLENEDWQATKYVLDGLDYGAKTKIELETTKTIMVSIEE